MKILVSALEPSANLHLKELKKHLENDIEFIGIFDKTMGKPLFDFTQFSIMGFVDVIKKISFLLKLNNQMAQLASEVDTVLLIDGSGFNLPLAKKIKKKYPNKKIIYYILPQAWAWKKRRIPIIEKNTDHLCSILPFEKDVYSKNANINYVGHPLLDQITQFKTKLTTNGNIAFMPGSRKHEIRTLMPIFIEVAKTINKNPILVIPQNFDQQFIDDNYGDISGFTISYDTKDTLLKCDFAFICSGTATLEAAIIGTPFTLCYIAKKVDYFIAKMLVKLNYIGLANIFFEKMGLEPMHLELIQKEVTVQNILTAYVDTNTPKFLRNSKILRQYLQNGSSQNVAKIINAQ